MAILQVSKTIIRYECECPHCHNKLKSDDIYSPFYGISDNEILDVGINGEICIWDYERNDFIDLGNPLNYYQLNELELLDKEVINIEAQDFYINVTIDSGK